MFSHVSLGILPRKLEWRIQGGGQRIWSDDGSDYEITSGVAL